MTPQQVADTVSKYSAELGRRGFAVARRSDVPFPSSRDALQHARWMCETVLVQLKDGQVEKAMRWLGFVQGILWTNGISSIDSMKADNTEPEKVT